MNTSGRFLEQKLALGSSFRCDQIHDCHRYDFGHTWLCCHTVALLKSDLDVQQTHLCLSLREEEEESVVFNVKKN